MQQHSQIPKSIDPFLAVREGSVRELVKCIDSGLDVNTFKCASGWSLLHRAAEHGHTDICQILIDAGAKVNIRTAWGWYTPLHLALAHGWVETSNCLFDNGADMLIKNKSGLTATKYAEKRGFAEAAEVFRVRARQVEHIRKHREREAAMKRASLI